MKAYCILFLSFLSHSLVGQQHGFNGLLFENFIYRPNVKTVQFYREGYSPQQILNTAATSLEQRERLLLKFDVLGNEAEYFYAKILHCHADWTPSDLSSAEYLNEYNEFTIEDYAFSFNTKTPYTHFKFRVPRLKISGNFLLVIYALENPTEPVITRRFIIYENLVEIIPAFTFSSQVSGRKSYQQLDFSVQYGNYEIQVPQTDIKVTLKQNQRWDNAIQGLPPLYVNEGQSILDYQYFANENAFKGGNEFRAFGIRHINFTDINLDKIHPTERMAEVLPEKTRKNRPFVNSIDINGKYVIENTTGGSIDLDGDYIRTVFRLESEKPLPGKVYIMGELTDWRIQPDFEMLHDEESGYYISSNDLKQGYYNYYFHFIPDGTLISPDLDEYFLEGSFFQTENFYEIIVYHRKQGGRRDRVIGYVGLDFIRN